MKNDSSIREKLSWIPYCIWVIPVLIFFVYYLNYYLNNWQASSIAKRVSAGSLVNYYNKADSGIELIRIIDNGIITGIDVYCNDVYLGKTPIEITTKEFVEKVPKWNKPPRQTSINTSYLNFVLPTVITKFDGLLMSYSPCDPLSSYTNRFKYDKNKNLKCFYWFNFEKDGCKGVEGNRALSSGYGKLRTYTPDVYFLSSKKHLETLLFALRQREYKPDKAWLDHFWLYSSLLSNELVWKSKNDVHLRNTVNTIVHAEFNIHDGMSQAECFRVVDAIMDRSEKSGSFIIPSVESYALEIVAPKVLDYICEQYKYLFDGLRNLWTRRDGNIPIDNFYYYYSLEGIDARILPLVHAIFNYHPPQIFNHLVYNYSHKKDENLLLLVGNYPKNNALRLVKLHFENVVMKNQFVTSTLFKSFKEIHNPDITLWMAQTIEKHTTNKYYSELREFFETRFRYPKDKKEDLINYVYSSKLPNEYKIRMLARIKHKESYEDAMSIVKLNPKNEWTLISYLSHNPNPHFEPFLLETLDKQYENLEIDRISSSLFRALIKCDTAKTREAVLDKWNENILIINKNIIRELSSLNWGDPVLTQWTPILSDIEDNELRVIAVEALARTETTQSWEVLNKWLEDVNDAVSYAALKAITDYTKLKNQAQALINGQIRPDDLLSPAVPYVWNGKDYVKESAR